MLKKILIVSLLLFILSSCSSSGNDLAISTPELSDDSSLVWDRPPEISLQVQDGYVEGVAEETFILGFQGTKTINVAQTPALSRNGKIKKFKELTLNAIADAVEKANADSLQVIKVTRVTSGFFPFYWKNSVTVKGRPIKIVASEMSVERADELRALKGARITGDSFVQEGGCSVGLADLFFWPLAVGKLFINDCRKWRAWGGY